MTIAGPGSSRGDLVIVGAGGHGREILDVVEAINRDEPHLALQGFVDDGDGPFPLIAARGTSVLGPVPDAIPPGALVAIAIGQSATRAAVDERLRAVGIEGATLIHPDASIGSDVAAEPGLMVGPGARVTTHVRFGRHVHLNPNSVVSHDCVLGDHVTVLGGALLNGTVKVGDRTVVGSGAVIRQGVTIGRDATIGAGAVVVESVPDGVTVVGIPARPLAR